MLTQIYTVMASMFPSGFSALLLIALLLFCSFTVVGVIMSFVYIINQLRGLFHG